MNKNEFVKEIKKLDKSCFYLVTVDESYDFQTMANIADILDRQGIKSVVMPKNINFKELPAESKGKLLEYIKREIGIKDGFDVALTPEQERCRNCLHWGGRECTSKVICVKGSEYKPRIIPKKVVQHE